MLIKILSWNVWNENKKSPSEIISFIFSHKADIVCLQEVTPALLNELRTRIPAEYACFVARDMRCAGEQCSLVLLSRYPVTRYRAEKTKKVKGWRSFFTFWNEIEEHLEFQIANIKIGKKHRKIINVHLEVGTGPKNRLSQFRYVLKKCKKIGKIRRAIIVGDLNIYGETWYERVVGCLWLGLKFDELLLNERDEFERVFRNRGLKNIFKGEQTFSMATSFQLDHILVPQKMFVSSFTVVLDQCGSDHQSIISEIKI